MQLQRFVAVFGPCAILGAFVAGCASESSALERRVDQLDERVETLEAPATSADRPEPQTLRALYVPAEMKIAFAEAIKKSGVEIPWFDIDESRFPPMIYGVIKEAPGKGVGEAANAMGEPRYTYGGCATYRDGEWYGFGLNVVPPQIAIEKDRMPELMHRMEQLAFSAFVTLQDPKLP